jgi:hypothetical protein
LFLDTPSETRLNKLSTGNIDDKKATPGNNTGGYPSERTLLQR